MHYIYSMNDVQTGIATVKELKVDGYLYDFIKAYLYGVYSGHLVDPSIKIIRCVAPSDNFSYKSKQIAISDDRSGEYYHVLDSKILSTIEYKNSLYDVILYWELDMNYLMYHIYVFGLGQTSVLSSELVDHIIASSMKHSPFNNKFLTFYTKEPGPSQTPEISLLNSVEYKESLENIFLPHKVKNQITLFTNVLKNYSTSKQSLRYLFSGKPGTGKTKLIRAIATECKGMATFIFTTGSEENISSLFELVGKFSPVVLCIDDVDMLTGSREEGMFTRLLAKFLQELDGIRRNDLFVLATTNDKKMVDIAASRPGRFDAVIDVSEIHPNQYLELIQSQTKNLEVVQLFDEEIMDLLEAKKVSGAFIVNVVKRLQLNYQYAKEEFNKENLKTFVRDSFDSFYKTPLEEKKFGFVED